MNGDLTSFARAAGALALTLATLIPLEGIASAAKAAPTPSSADAPAASPPSLSLEVVPIAELHGPWRLRIVNTGTVPVRLAADANLVALDIVPPPKAPSDADSDSSATTTKKSTKAQKNKKQKAGAGVLHCRFPADMRPSDDDPRSLVLPPKRAYVEAFDIRAACFGAELDALVPGATVTPHFGWTPATFKARAKSRKATPVSASHQEAPFAVSPIDIDSTSAPIVQISPLKEIDGDSYVLKAPSAPVALVALVAPVAPVAAHADHDDGDDDNVASAPLVLSLPRYHDQESRIDIPSPVTVKNKDVRKHEIFFRASRISFDVVDPTGTATSCGAPPEEQSLRELYTRLPPGGSASLPMMVSAVCDPETFSRAGVYEVVAHVDDRELGGSNIGLSAFDGLLTSKRMLVRIHTDARRHGRRPPRLE